MDKELTPEMKRAIAYAKEHGDKLARYPGGFWREPRYHPHMYSFGDPPSPYFKTSTIEGIVRRGYGQYTVWKDGRNGRFPLEMTLCGQKWRRYE